MNIACAVSCTLATETALLSAAEHLLWFLFFKYSARSPCETVINMSLTQAVLDCKSCVGFTCSKKI